MTSKSQNYTFIAIDESNANKENVSEEIPSGNRWKNYVEIVRFDDIDYYPWILWLSAQDTWTR